MADKGGVNSISWSQQTNVVTTTDNNLNNNNSNNDNMNTKSQVIQRFASGGCDNKVKIWRFNYQTNKWEMETELSGHSNWVRGVAWAPIPGASSYSIVASCSEVLRTIFFLISFFCGVLHFLFFDTAFLFGCMFYFSVLFFCFL